MFVHVLVLVQKSMHTMQINLDGVHRYSIHFYIPKGSIEM